MYEFNKENYNFPQTIKESALLINKNELNKENYNFPQTIKELARLINKNERKEKLKKLMKNE